MSRKTPLPLASSQTFLQAFKAVQENRVDLLKTLLLAPGGMALLTQRHSELGSTLLHESAIFGHIDCVKLLIQAGPRGELLNHKHRTPIHEAIFYEQTDCIQALLAAKCNVNTKDRDGNTPLHNAACRGLVLIPSLLRAGADLNVQNRKGHTPLYVAVQQQKTSNVRLLLEAGADPNLQTKSMRSPLYVAAERGNEEILDLLLEYGAEIEAVNGAGVSATALHHAAGNGGTVRPWAVFRLLQAGANPNPFDSFGHTPLYYYFHFAASDDCVSGLISLLEAGANHHLIHNPTPQPHNPIQEAFFRWKEGNLLRQETPIPTLLSNSKPRL